MNKGMAWLQRDVQQQVWWKCTVAVVLSHVVLVMWLVIAGGGENAPLRPKSVKPVRVRAVALATATKDTTASAATVTAPAPAKPPSTTTTAIKVKAPVKTPAMTAAPPAPLATPKPTKAAVVTKAAVPAKVAPPVTPAKVAVTEKAAVMPKAAVAAVPVPPSRRRELLAEAQSNLHQAGSAAAPMAVPQKAATTLATAIALPSDMAVKTSEYHQLLDIQLRQQLRLPEHGTVTVTLTIDPRGKVTACTITDASSPKNRLYVQTTLPQLQLPPLAPYMAQVTEHTLQLTLKS